MTRTAPVKRRKKKSSPMDVGAGSTIRVVSLQTGLSLGTLRAWERRYGFPNPERRPGSNRRLYSAADVERLRSICRALDRGYRVGDVIHKPASELEALVSGASDEGARRLEPAGAATVPALIDLLAADRVSELEDALRRAAVALGPRRFVTELAHPFAEAVGAAWAEARLSIRHEHLATEALVTQIRQMLASYQDLEARPLILLATLPGELHTLPLQMVALYLVTLGAKPRLLGGSTPPSEIAESARVFAADVVGVTVMPTSDRRQARRDLKVLRGGLPRGVEVWIGGGGADALLVEDAHTRVVTSWAALDEAVDRYRRRPKKSVRSQQEAR